MLQAMLKYAKPIGMYITVKLEQTPDGLQTGPTAVERIQAAVKEAEAASRLHPDAKVTLSLKILGVYCPQLSLSLSQHGLLWNIATLFSNLICHERPWHSRYSRPAGKL